MFRMSATAPLRLMPQGFPTNAHLHCSGADALVRGRPPGRPVELWKCLTLRTSSGTRASRGPEGTPQGVRPTILCRIPYLGKPCGITLTVAALSKCACRARPRGHPVSKRLGLNAQVIPPRLLSPPARPAGASSIPSRLVWCGRADPESASGNPGARWPLARDSKPLPGQQFPA